MKSFSTVIDMSTLSKLPKEELDYLAQIGFNKMFEIEIVTAIRSHYGSQVGPYGHPQQGLPLNKGRIWARILEKLQGESTTIDLEEAEYDFIRQVMTHDDTKFDPSRYLIAIQYVRKVELVAYDEIKKELEAQAYIREGLANGSLEQVTVCGSQPFDLNGAAE
jgi:hypothetical protein